MRSTTPLIAPLGVSAAVAIVLVGLGLSSSSGAEERGSSPPSELQLIDTSSPFSHDHHMNAARVGQAMTCNSCHEMVAETGQCPKAEVRYPKHEACAGCHTANFYTPPLTICGNCHKSASFTANNPLKDLTRLVTPRRAEFSHKAHAGNDCTSCHALQRGGVSVAHPSHPNCCQCHTDPETAPAMTSCESCHAASKNAGRPPSKIHDFSHKNHNTDPRNGLSMECLQCHTNAEAAQTLRGIRAPPMSSCVSCHDGSDPSAPHPTIPNAKGSGAFHFSSCLKCHVAGSIQNVPLPADHPTDAPPPGAIQ
jgi:hypothetical protein